MSERIDQFCEALRLKLTGIESNMETLKSNIDSSATTAEQAVRKHLEVVKRRVEQEREKLEAAREALKKWAVERRAVSDEMIAEWKGKLEKAKLQSRARNAERYAEAAAALAASAVDEAEQAALEAWLARNDAENAQSTKAA